jgi:aminoglycoside phosphotransferase family enzyme
MHIRDKIDFLRRPGNYPERTGSVETVETHMSWVFLTDTHAYKLKKPVRYPFLDFRTIDARHIDCLEEVRLNRRLAGDVYLGVVPLAGQPGNLRLGGDSRAVDWLVRMRRLPSPRMLDRLIQTRQAGPGQLNAVGHLLGRFYRQRRPVEIAADEYRRCLRDEIEENGAELAQGPFALPGERVHSLCEHQRRFLDSADAILDGRVEQGQIVEGHGDLRPEHVCLTDPPVVIDCLEFKRQFRILDPADELAYLGMECERLGAGWAGPELLAAYGEITGDKPPPELVHFHASVRAMLRAKLALWHTRDHDIGEPDRWVRKALSYIEAAERHALRF